MELSINLYTAGETNVVECRGGIVCGNECEQFRKLLCEALQRGGPLVVDMSGVTRIDCAGLGALADAARVAHERGIPAALIGAHGMVAALLVLTGLAMAFDPAYPLPNVAVQRRRVTA